MIFTLYTVFSKAVGSKKWDLRANYIPLRTARKIAKGINDCGGITVKICLQTYPIVKLMKAKKKGTEQK